jgi:subtilisin family serine protease
MPRLPRISRNLDGEKEIDVLVRFQRAPGDTEDQKVAKLAGISKARFGFIQSGLYRVKAKRLADLSTGPDVEYITPDRTVKATLDKAGATVGSTVAEQYGYTGSGAGVAVLDSGIYQPTLLNGSIVASKNFTTSSTTADLYGHGTHVAGIIAARFWTTRAPASTVA